MTNKVSLSLVVLAKTRKMLKELAFEQDKTMTAMIEEIIRLKWQETREAENQKRLLN